MPVYRRRTHVDASLEEVWNFHSRVGGLEALTPSWMGLGVEDVRGPDGERDPDVLVEGTRLRMSVRPFGVAPRQRWTSRIVHRERGDDEAVFRDEMEGGPFRRWIHTHRFVADPTGTTIEDVVEYELPLGELGRLAAPLAKVGLEPMFRYRHRRSRELLG